MCHMPAHTHKQSWRERREERTAGDMETERMKEQQGHSVRDKRVAYLKAWDAHVDQQDMAGVTICERDRGRGRAKERVREKKTGRAKAARTGQACGTSKSACRPS